MSNKIYIGFVCFDSLHPSKQFFSHVGMGLPGLNQYSVIMLPAHPAFFTHTFVSGMQ